MYDCLPMYHTAGGLVATGARAAQRRLGGDPREILRARILGRRGALRLHAVPVYRRAVPLPRAIRRRIRTRRGTSCGSPAATVCGRTCGTSSRPRFRIPHILEFYGATEGNVKHLQLRGQGRRGRARARGSSPHRFPIAVVRFDVERQQPVRNAGGLLHRCDADEPGEVIGKIVNDAVEAGQPLRGLCRDEPRPNKKILHDVFEKGDAWFRTGDLMRKDERRLFLFRRPHRRHLPLEGRERLDHRGGRRRSTPSPASLDANVYGVDGARAATAAPAWRRSSATDIAISPRCTRIWRHACRTMRGRCSCASAARSR